MQESQLLVLQEAQTLVTDLLSNKLSKNIKFHTLQHTQEVVAACQVLADYQRVGEDDRFALYLAAWFHDTGYSSGSSKDHEAVSNRLADGFMASQSMLGSAANTFATVYTLPVTTPVVGGNVDTTTALTVDMFGTFSIANAGNSIQVHTYTLESIN